VAQAARKSVERVPLNCGEKAGINCKAGIKTAYLLGYHDMISMISYKFIYDIFKRCFFYVQKNSGFAFFSFQADFLGQDPGPNLLAPMNRFRMSGALQFGWNQIEKQHFMMFHDVSCFSTSVSTKNSKC
jgi:hypothetical protein